MLLVSFLQPVILAVRVVRTWLLANIGRPGFLFQFATSAAALRNGSVPSARCRFLSAAVCTLARPPARPAELEWSSRSVAKTSASSCLPSARREGLQKHSWCETGGQAGTGLDRKTLRAKLKGSSLWQNLHQFHQSAVCRGGQEDLQKGSWCKTGQSG